MSLKNIVIFFISPVILSILSLLYTFNIVSSKAAVEKYTFFIFIFILLGVLLIYFIFVAIGIIVIDLRRKKSGAKYQVQLSVLFLLIIFINTVPILFLTSKLMNRSVDIWFKKGIGKSLSDSIEIISENYSIYKSRTKKGLDDLRDVFQKRPGFIDDFCSISGIDFLFLFKNNRLDRRYLKSSLVKRGLRGPLFSEIKKLITEKKSGQIELRTIKKREYTLGIARMQQNVVVVLGYFIPEILLDKRESIVKSYQTYKQVMIFKEPIKGIMFYYILFITLLVSFVSIIISFILSRGISKPMSELVKGTKRIAAGDFDYTVLHKGHGEMGTLINSFNYMTRELRASKQILSQFKKASAWREFLKRMLVSIQKPLQEIKTVVGKPGKGSELQLIGNIKSSVISIENIVNDFLKYAQIDHLEFIPEDINKLIKNSLENFKDLDFKLKLYTHIPLISVDRKRFINSIIEIINLNLGNLQRKSKIYISTFKSKGIFGEFAYIQIEIPEEKIKEGVKVDSKKFVKIREEVEYNHGRIWLEEPTMNVRKFIIELPV